LPGYRLIGDGECQERRRFAPASLGRANSPTLNSGRFSVRFTMKFSHLLQERQGLLRQAHLANLAYAHVRLARFVERIARARLAGAVRLRQADPERECFWPQLIALEGSPAVLEEHFTDEDVVELAELLGFATATAEVDLTFPLEELAGRYLLPLRRELERGGVAVPARPDDFENSRHGAGEADAADHA